MKKVLWLVSWYPNRLDNFDGDFIQRHARAVALYCRVHIIYVKKDDNLPAGTTSTEKSGSGTLTEEIIYYNRSVTGIKLLDKFLSHKSYKKQYADAINRYVKESGIPDAVHVHVAMKAGLAGLWMKKKWGTPFIVTEHWTGYHKQSVPSVYDYNPVYRKLNKRILQEAEILLPVSNDLGQTIDLFSPGLKYNVIPNVVDTSIFKYQPQGSGRFRFIHISYMNFQKNPEGIFAAAALLRDRGCNFEILMLGNENEALRALAEKYSLFPQTVTFKRAIPYSEVAGQLQAAAAFVLFSRFENLPCVILEALCCGLPVISSNVGGISEVIDKDNGLLVDPENAEELANAMQKMINEYQAYNREKIAAEASAKYNYEKVGGQITAFYK